MKKLVNKNVIKAMTIGISALMVANSMNLTAFAGTEDPAIPQGGEDPKVDNNNGIGTQSQLSQSLDSLGVEAVTIEGTEGTKDQNTIQEAIGLVEDLVEFSEQNFEKVQDVDENGNPKVDEKGNPVYKDSLNNDIVDTTAQIKGELDNDENGQNGQNDAVEDIEKVQQDINDMKAPAEAINDNVQGAEAFLNEVEKIVNGDGANVKGVDADLDDANNALGDGDASITAVVGTAYDVVDGAQAKLDGAATPEDALDILGDATQAAQDSDDGVKDSREKYDAAKSNYDTKKAKYDSALKNLNAAKEALFGKVDENGDPVLDENGNPVLGAVDQFLNSKGQAVTDAKEAEEEIQRLSDEVAVLKAEADEAKEAVNNSRYGLIAALEKQIKDNAISSSNYQIYRNLAIEIVKDYYVTDVLDGIFDSLVWVKPDEPNNQLVNEKNKKDTYAYDPANIRVETDEKTGKNTYYYVYDNGEEESIGDALKFGILKYYDSEGNLQTKYINWKTDNENKFGNAAGKSTGIVIFEKTEHISIEGKDLSAEDLEALKDGPIEKTIGDVKYVLGMNEAGVIESYVETGFQPIEGFTVVNDTSLDETTYTRNENDDIIQTIVKDVEVDEESEKTTYSYNNNGELVKTVNADVTTTTYTTNHLNIEAQDNTLDKSVDAKDAFVKKINDIIDGLAENQEVTIVVGENTVTLNKNTSHLLVTDDLTVYGYNEGVTITDSDGDIAASTITFGTEDLAKAAYVTAINAVLDGLSAEQSIVINGTTYTKDSDRLATTDSAEKFEAYGYTKASTVDVDETNSDISAIAKDKATETAAKEAYLTVINGILDGLTDEQNIVINGTTYTKDSPRLAITDSAEKFAAYGYKKGVVTNDGEDVSITESQKNKATEAEAKKAYAEAINAILDGLSDDQRIKIGDATYTNKSPRLTENDSDDTYKAYGYAKASTEKNENSNIDAIAKDKETELAAKTAYVEALNAILRGLTAEQSITINGKELKNADADKTVTTDNCANYGYKSTYTFEGYYVDGVFSKTVKLETDTKNKDVLLYAGHIEDWKWKIDILDDSSEEGAKEQCLEDGKDWIAYQKTLNDLRNIIPFFKERRFVSDSNMITGTSHESIYGALSGKYVGEEWTAYGHVTLEYVDVKEKTVDYSLLLEAVGADASQKERVEAVRQQLAADGMQVLEFSGWDWILLKGTIKYIDTKDCEAKGVYLDVAEDATEAEVDAALKEALKTNSNGVYSANYTSKTAKRHYGYEAITYKLNTNIYGYGAATITEYTDTYGYQKVEVTKNTNLYGYQLVDATEKTKTYGFDALPYDETTTVVTPDNIVIRQEINGTVDATAKTEYRNDMWYNGPAEGDGTRDGRIFLVEYDNNGEAPDTYNTNGKIGNNKLVSVDDKLNNDFRAKVDNAAQLVKDYGELAARANKAQEELGAAKTKVTELKGKIQALNTELRDLIPSQFKELFEEMPEIFDSPEFSDIDPDQLDDIMTKELFDKIKKNIEERTGEIKEQIRVTEDELAKAEGTLKEAEDLNKIIQDKLAGLKIKFNEKVAELTAITDETAPLAETIDEGGADEGGAAGGAPVIGGGANLFVAPGAGGAPAVVDGDGGAAVVDDGGEPVVIENIGDQEAALAETIPTDEKKIYDIIDDPTALADLIEEPGVHISWWWWLLIIAALGATGWALYRKYKKNKAAEANGGKKDQK